MALFIFLNLGNHFQEETFNQFYKEKTFYKPNYQKMLEIIDLSESQNYILDLNFNSDKKKYEFSAINHYIKNLSINKEKLSLFKYQSFIESNEKKAWLICLTNFGKDKLDELATNLCVIELPSTTSITKSFVVPFASLESYCTE